MFLKLSISIFVSVSPGSITQLFWSQTQTPQGAVYLDVSGWKTQWDYHAAVQQVRLDTIIMFALSLSFMLSTRVLYSETLDVKCNTNMPKRGEGSFIKGGMDNFSYF